MVAQARCYGSPIVVLPVLLCAEIVSLLVLLGLCAELLSSELPLWLLL